MFKYYWNSSAKRAYWIDYVKGIAIILVVVGHLAGGLVSSGLTEAMSFVTLTHSLYFLRMPVFFVISGLFFRKSVNKRSKLGFVSNRFNTILYPYLIWAFIQLTIQLLFSEYSNSSKTVHHYLYIFTNPGGGRLDQFWYLYVLFFLNIVYLCFDHFIKNKSWHLCIGLAFLFLSEFFVDVTIVHGIAFYYIYYAIGDIASSFIWNKEKFKNIQKTTVVITISIIFIFAEYHWLQQDIRPHAFHFFLLATIGFIFFIIVAVQLQKYDPAPWIRLIGFHSLYIYIWHILVGSALRVFCTYILNIQNVHLIFIIITINGIMLPVIFFALIQRLRLNFLVEKTWTLRRRYPRPASLE